MSALCLRAPHRLPLVVLRDERLELLCQSAVLLAELGVSAAVLLDLGLDVAERPLEVGGDLLPLQVVLPAPLQGLLLPVLEAHVEVLVWCHYLALDPL